MPEQMNRCGGCAWFRDSGDKRIKGVCMGFKEYIGPLHKACKHWTSNVKRCDTCASYQHCSWRLGECNTVDRRVNDCGAGLPFWTAKEVKDG